MVVKNVWMIWLVIILLIATNNVANAEIEKAGDVLQILIPATAYVTTFCLDDNEGRNQFYKSFLANLAVTHGLKLAIDKERPNNGNNDSFPSGHTSTAFQGAAFIQKRYGWKYGAPAYVAASFVGYSRVEADKHHLEDVIAGAAIGILSSYYFTTPYKGVVIAPIANNGVLGLKAKVSF